MKYICIGKIVNTHGIKGEVRLLSNFEFKEKVFHKDMTIYIGNHKEKEVISSYRVHKQFDMICMKGYSNINEVLKYKGMKVYIHDDDLKLDEQEFLDSDLIGLNVQYAGKMVGTVKDVLRYPMQKLIVVKNAEKDCLIPYVSDIIEEINLKEGFLRVKYIKGLM